jgi:hypothetical protein
VEAGSGIPSLQTAIEALGKGEQLILCVPSTAIGEKFRSSLLARDNTSLLDTAALSGKNGEEAAAHARKQVTPSRTRKLLVLEISGGDQPWHRK